MLLYDQFLHILWGFQKNGGTTKSSILDGDFPS